MSDETTAPEASVRRLTWQGQPHTCRQCGGDLFEPIGAERGRDSRLLHRYACHACGTQRVVAPVGGDFVV